MESYAQEWVRKHREMGMEVNEYDNLVHPDGTQERITDPAYWIRRNEIQHALKGERPLYGAWGEVYWVKD